MRTVVPGGHFRVVLRRMPEDADGEPAVVRVLVDLRIDSERASRLVQTMPTVVATGLTEEQAQRMAEALAAAGASADVVGSAPDAPSLDPVRARRSVAVRRDAQRRSAGFVALALATVAALVLVPKPMRLTLRPVVGTTYRFDQRFEVQHQVARPGTFVTADGTWRWTLERTVESRADGKVTVTDRFVDPVGSFRASGEGAAGYEQAVTALQSALATTSVRRVFNDLGKRIDGTDPQSVASYDPYPRPVDLLFGRMVLPDRTVKPEVSWFVGITETQGIQFTVERKEQRTGRPAAKVTFKNAPLVAGVGPSPFSTSQSQLELSGTAWLDRKTGWPDELRAHLESSFATLGMGGMIAGSMDRMVVDVEHRLVGTRP